MSWPVTRPVDVSVKLVERVTAHRILLERAIAQGESLRIARAPLFIHDAREIVTTFIDVETVLAKAASE